ncbi:MAG: hypothetical protein ABIE23_04480 [archaeon]
MDRKGFTLFTALVAFVLIVLSVLLVHGMIRAERDRIDLIAGIEEQTTMQTIADMERSDAMQILIYDLRFIMERWFNQQSKCGESEGKEKCTGGIGPVCKWEEGEEEKVFCSFDELVDNFSVTYFGGNGTENEDAASQMSNWMATSLMNLLPREKRVGSYVIRIEDDVNEETSVTDKLREGLEILIEKSANSEEGDFFEVIECENGDPNNCIGTFYLNFRASELTDKEYEKLPQISIRNTATGRTIRQAILPRENFRVYVPLRIFKAIAEARALALDYYAEGEEIDWTENYGLLSPRIHNEIEEMRIGMCDAGVCYPRENPYEEPDEKNIKGHLCPGAPFYSPGKWVKINCAGSELSKRMKCENADIYYDPQETESMKSALDELVRNRLEFLVKESIGRTFEIKQEDRFELKKVELSSTDIEVTRSKKIIVAPGSEKTESKPNDHSSYKSNYFFGEGSSACPMVDSEARVGLFYNYSDKNVYKNPVPNGKLECEDITNGNVFSHCAEVKSIEFAVFFTETDGNYVVNKKLLEEGGPLYGIKIKDNWYTPFTARYNAPLDPQGSCALASDAYRNDLPCNLSDWTCESRTFMEMGGFGNIEESYGCSVP